MINHITLNIIKALCFTAIFGVLIPLAHADNNLNDPGTLSNRASKTSPNPGQSPIRIGVLAKRGRSQCLQKWGPTAEYLSSVIPERSFTILPLDFDEILAAVKRKEVEFILANSSFYIELEVLFGAKRIATLNNLQSDHTALDIFAGTIFCRADRHDLNSIHDLKNKTFMAVDQRSLGGWHMAWRELMDKHIDPKRDFKELRFGGTHDAVAYAIWKGVVDAGCVRSDTLERMASEGKIDLDDFKLISQHQSDNEIIHFMHSTRHYPEWPFVKAAHTDEDLSKKVALALMTMPVDSTAARAAKCAGWTIPNNYQPVRECLMELRLPPYEDYGKISLSGFIRQYYIWLLGITALMVLIVVSLNRASRLKRNLRESLLANEERKRAQRFLQTVIDGFPEAMMVINLDYTIALANRTAIDMTKGESLTPDHLKCHRVSHGSDTPCDSDMHPCPLNQVLNTQKTVMVEHIHHDKEGKQVVFEIVAAPIFNEKGEIVQIIESCRDVSDRKRHEEILSAHLMLSDFSVNHSVRELLRRCIDEAERLTGSIIGFFHFVEPDQQTTSLQIWSSNTLKRMGKYQPQKSHYSINKAGICAECVNARQAVIHNDNNIRPHPIESLEEYPPVYRELAVPVLRGEKIVAILGVGNKEMAYDEEDVGIISDIAGMTWDIVLRKWAEEALRESEEKYRSMMEAMVDAAYICSSDYHIEYMNPAMIERIGRDGTGEYCYTLIHGLEQPCPDCDHEKVMQGEHVVSESQSLEEGKTYHVSSSPIFHVDGTASKLTVFRDITEIKDMEARLLQAQKMEAIGTLASGIAHDFNNVLFPLIGYAELLKAEIPGEDPKQNHIDQILKAAFRSRDLVSQILAFSRQNTQRLIPMKMQPIVKEALKLLRSSIPTTIDIEHDIDPGCGLVIADPTQIHQIIMNLCTNSLHAMEERGGKIIVTLKQVRLDKKPVASSDLLPGLYALLTVSDTGNGIDKDIINRIFDPYFTTKGTGKGTGLGLSVVQSIVKSGSGEIQVASNPGRGTTMSVYLPIVERETDKHPVVDMQDVEGGTERILLVDDEKDIVEMLEQLLERLGYRVTAFTSSIDALVAFKTNPHSFDLILSDVTMPNKTGIELAMEIKRTRPEIRVILCTGFSDQINEAKCEALGIQGLVMKPVVSDVLAKTIRAALDNKRDA